MLSWRVFFSSGRGTVRPASRSTIRKLNKNEVYAHFLKIIHVHFVTQSRDRDQLRATQSEIMKHETKEGQTFYAVFYWYHYDREKFYFRNF